MDYWRNWRTSLSVVLGLAILWLGLAPPVWASPLAERVSQFPDWSGPPPLQIAEGDLVYPDWLAGHWQVTSTLVEQIAPLQPEIVSPGFERNRRWLDQPITFPIRFWVTDSGAVVADRRFNGLSLARAYLGGTTVTDVKLDPESVNRQVTLFRTACPEQKTCERQLVTVISQRRTEAPRPQEFITSELYQQEFLGQSQPYFNVVENTTDYTYSPTDKSGLVGPIQANQITAIYLSPQDPDYFRAKGRPVALYQYRLEFSPVATERPHNWARVN